MRLLLNTIRRGVAVALLAIVALSASSCSVTFKTLKEGDPDKIYALAMEEYNAEEWGKAINLFDVAEPYYANYNRDDSLKFYRARSVFKECDYEYAASLFDEYRKQYGRSPFIEEAEGMYTICHYYMAPSAKRDQTLSEKAIYAINEFISRHPSSDKVEQFEQMRTELIDRIYEKAFINAYTYYKIGYYKSAIVAFRNANVEYPESSYREDVSYYIVASSYELADNSVLPKKESRYMDMMDSYYTFIAEFPDSKYRKEVDTMMAKGRKYLDQEIAKRAEGKLSDRDIVDSRRENK